MKSLENFPVDLILPPNIIDQKLSPNRADLVEILTRRITQIIRSTVNLGTCSEAPSIQVEEYFYQDQVVTSLYYQPVDNTLRVISHVDNTVTTMPVQIDQHVSC